MSSINILSLCARLLVNEIDLIRSGAWDDKILEQMNGVSLALERHALPVPEAPTGVLYVAISALAIS